mgnify:CR=1 FL=1
MKSFKISYDGKLLTILNHLESLGNSEEESIKILSGLLHDCKRPVYPKSEGSKRQTAMIQLRQLPYGLEIIKKEQSL